MSGGTPPSRATVAGRWSPRAAARHLTILALFAATFLAPRPQLLLLARDPDDDRDARMVGGAGVNVAESVAASFTDPGGAGNDDKCSRFLDGSVPKLWRQLGDSTKLASYIPREHANDANFTGWIDGLFDAHYGAGQMASSTMHPPDSQSMMRVLEIMEARYDHLRNKGGKNNNATANSGPPPLPLSIAVLGGSVTAGMGCLENPAGIPATYWKQKQHSCAFPARLERLFNEVLFDGLKVVRVTNLANGGASTEVGKVLLQYRLFGEAMKRELPHVVLWAHGPNDVKEPDKRTFQNTHLPDFVEAARDLRPCDPHLPLVAFVDDFHGLEPYSAADDVSSMVYRVASWYGLMGISHANVVRRDLFAHRDDPEYVSDVLGGDWLHHPGMGSHIGVAWTIFYSFIRSFVEACEVRADGEGSDQETIGSDGLHSKYLGRFREGETSEVLNARWRGEVEDVRDRCSGWNTTSSDGGGVVDVCAYSWVVNRMAGFEEPSDVRKALRPVLKMSEGWEAAGNPVKQPRTGYYARKAGAKFSLSVHATIPTKYLTIISMVSDGNDFKDAVLRVSVRIGEDGAEETHDISGHHGTRSSIHVPHKFKLPGSGAGTGDAILLDAELVSGDHFKVQGIALCSY